MKHGNLGEAAVQLHLMKDGYEVFTPAFDNASCDMIAIKDSKLYRVEVKTTSSKRYGKYKVQLKRVRSNRSGSRIEPFDKSSVDILAIYIEPEDKVVLIDTIDLNVTSELTLDIGG